MDDIHIWGGSFGVGNLKSAKNGCNSVVAASAL